MSDCIFCKIIRGELPSSKVYEDEDILAILDIKPTNHGHTLIFPKTHSKNIEETSEETLAKLIKVVKKVGKSIKENLPAASYNVCENNDEAAGQVIPHLHFHVVPRHRDDGIRMWPQRSYPDGREAEILEKIKIN